MKMTCTPFMLLRSRKPAHTSGGFTLFEAILALAFLAVALTPLLGGMSHVMVASRDVDRELPAIQLATAALETTIQQSFSAVASSPKTALAAMPGFSRQVTVTSIDANLKKIDVDVFWMVSGKETSIKLSTYRVNL